MRPFVFPASGIISFTTGRYLHFVGSLFSERPTSRLDRTMTPDYPAGRLSPEAVKTCSHSETKESITARAGPASGPTLSARR